jgi:hypothetical protein
MPNPIELNAGVIDFGPRVTTSATVAASPAAAVETTVCTLTIPDDVAVTEGVLLFAQAAFTVGTNGVSAVLQIRQTNTAGTSKGTTGATTQTAANLANLSVLGFDTGPTLPGQVYVATLTVASATAPSAVSAARLFALVV